MADPTRTNTPKLILLLIPVIAGVLVLFGPTILTGKAFFWGLPILQFVPWWVQVKAGLVEGVLPLWNPNVGMGAPLLANYQLGFFYPPNWLYLVGGILAGAKGIAWLQAGLVGMHLLWTGIGMLLLARELKLNLLGQIVASLSFTFSGYIIARAWFLTINHAVAWLPWILLFGFKLAVTLRTNLQEHRSKPSILISSGFLGLVFCATMQLLSGHAQISWYTGILNFFWFLFWIYTEVPAAGVYTPTSAGKGRKQLLLAGAAAVGFFLIAMLLSVGLAAIQLIPTAEYLGFSPRASEVSYEIAMTYSFWPWRFIGLIAPNLFGNPALGNYWGYANFWEDAIYIGLIPILLAVRSIFGLRRGNGYTNLIKLLIGTCILAFILALGKNTPVFPFLYRYVPTFDMFNGPTRWSILAVFSLSLLAAIGSQSWLRPTGRGLYWTRLGTAGAVAVMLGAGLAWFVLRNSTGTERLETMVFALALAGFWGIGGGILSLTAPSEYPGRGFQPWYLPVVIWILLDLLVAGYGLNPATSLALYDPDLVPPLKNDGRVYLPADEEYDIKFDHYFRFDRFQAVDDWLQIRETYLPNLAILNHYTPLVNNFDPLLLDRLEIWINTIDELPDEAAARFLNLSNVSAVVNKDDAAASGARISAIQPGQAMRWFSCARSISEPNALLAEMKAKSDLLLSVLYLEQNPLETTEDCPNQSVAEIELEQKNIRSKRIRVDSSTPGWLMMSESWYPGWRATVDGQAVELIRADYIFQAVPVPAGEHIVEVFYSPNSFKLGLFVTIFSTAVMLIIIAFKRLRPSYSIGRQT